MRLVTLLLICMLSIPVLRGDAAWEPIPTAIWNQKDTGALTDAGATIVKARYHFTDFSLEYQVRIHVYSERGKAAASWPPFPQDTLDLEGRTVYPDGREMPFNSTQDFHEVKMGSYQHWNWNEHVVVPPGLTDNCVVDFRYRVRRWLPGTPLGAYGKWQFAKAFPIETLVVEIPSSVGFSWKVKPGSRTRREATQRVENREGTVFTLKDIPALPEVPFALRATLDSPSFIAYRSYFQLVQAHPENIEKCWDLFTRKYQENLAGISTGKAYRTFSEGLRQGLSPSPIRLASELLPRLNGQIKNLEHLTHQEAAAQPRKEGERIDPRDLDAAVKRGSTTPAGMIYLYLALLKDAGIQPRIALAVNRNQGFFSISEVNPGQFEGILVGIDEPGQPTLWVEPGQRFLTPGLIRDPFQGTQALQLDSGTWTHQVIALPLPGSGDSVQKDTYRLEILDDEDRFTLEERFSGQGAFGERQEYYALKVPEQERHLRESLEGHLTTLEVTTAQVENATDPTRDFTLKVGGRIERSTHRTRKVIPFPLTSPALNIPQDLAPTRQVPIVLPHALTQIAESSFRIPAGMTWAWTPPFMHSNLFGDVSFQAERVDVPGGQEIKAVLKVRLATTMAPPESWGELVTFLGWIQEARRKVLVLEKTPTP